MHFDLRLLSKIDHIYGAICTVKLELQTYSLGLVTKIAAFGTPAVACLNPGGKTVEHSNNLLI